MVRSDLHRTDGHIAIARLPSHRDATPEPKRLNESATPVKGGDVLPSTRASVRRLLSPRRRADPFEDAWVADLAVAREE